MKVPDEAPCHGIEKISLHWLAVSFGRGADECFEQAPCLPHMAKVASDRFHLWLGVFVLLKVCNFAHCVVKFESWSDFWCPAEHFPTYRLLCKRDSSVCLLFLGIECSIVCRTETFVTNHFSSTKEVRNKVRSAFSSWLGFFRDTGCINGASALRFLAAVGSGEKPLN